MTDVCRTCAASLRPAARFCTLCGTPAVLAGPRRPQPAARATQRFTFEHADLLARVTLFAGLDRLALAKLAGYVDTIVLAPDTIICRQEEPADALYIIVRGTFGVFVAAPDRPGEASVHTLAPGEVFGEMALLSDEPRSATVRALDEGEVLRLEKERFLGFLRDDPAIALAIIALLSRRVRALNDAVVQSAEVSPQVTGFSLTLPNMHERAFGGSREVAARLTDAEPWDDARMRVSGSDRGHPAAPTAESSTAATEDRRLPTIRAVVGVSLACAFAVGAALAHGDPRWAFALLLGAAFALWITGPVPDIAVGLGLVIAWLIFDLTTPEQAASGFASTDWLFALATFGIAAAVARSGLLFRVGLLLARWLPRGLIWQATALLLTGVILSPLLPSHLARVTLMGPLVLAVSDGLRLRDRGPAAAVLGQAAWIGAGPLMFLFLNASPFCLLAWGLLPEASRNHFDWLHWLGAALPLGLAITAGTLVTLFVGLRPGPIPAPAPGRLRVQLALLGPLRIRDYALIAVLALMVVGWLTAPAIGLEMGTVAVLGLLGTVLTGYFDRDTIQKLDWNYLLFYGVALTIARLETTLGVDRGIADAVAAHLRWTGTNPLVFVLGTACLTLLARLVLPQLEATLVLCLALIPVAPTFGIDPWVVVMTVLAASVMWYLPGQNATYLVAHAATEGRLYSHAQARRVSLAYAAVTLAGLAITVPYWRLLGLL